MSLASPDDTLLAGRGAAQRRLRIALVTETYPPDVNGVAMSVARLVDGLAAREHRLQLIRPRQEQGRARDAPSRIEEVFTRAWPVPRYPGLSMGVPCKSALVRLWSRRRPDVVHIATEGPLGWSALRAARELALPLSSDFRTNFHAYGQHYRLGWLATPVMAYLRHFHNRAHVTMVPTAALRAQLEADGFERLSVVSRGIDTRLFDPARRSDALRSAWGAGRDDLVIACVGRLAPEKNLAVVLRATQAVRERLPQARLLFVGDGPMRAELQASCPQAHFAGQRKGEDLAAHYASADLFLFPSLTETYGNVVAEAMASGLPVVAFDNAAAGQLIRPGRNGVLVAGERADAFARAALALVADNARRVAIGAAARASVLGLGWDRVVLRFEAALVQAMEHQRSIRPGALRGLASASMPPAARTPH